MRSLQKPKEVQSLTRQVAAPSHFIFKVTDKYLSFFKVLNWEKRLYWTEKCEEAFQELKKHLGKVSFLSKLKVDEPLLLYLAVTNKAVSSMIIRKESNHQLPIYYISKALLPAQAWCLGMDHLFHY